MYDLNKSFHNEVLFDTNDVCFVISGFMERKINNKAWYALKVWSSCDWLSSLFSKRQDDFD